MVDCRVGVHARCYLVLYLKQDFPTLKRLRTVSPDQPGARDQDRHIGGELNEPNHPTNPMNSTNPTNPTNPILPWYNRPGMMSMHTSTSRKIGVFAALLVLMFVALTCASAPVKPIPPDEANPRLQTVLQELSRTAQARPEALREAARDHGIPLQENQVTVIVEPASGHISSISRAAIAAIGGKVEASSRQLMRVRIPVDKLESLADKVSGVAFIRLPYRPRELTVTSEGVALTGADDFHAAGYYGQGTKVAIIDLGFIGLAAAQAAGELDNVVYTHDYTGGGLETYTEHGTAVAEIVADMAPQVSLYLLMIGDSVDLQNATQYCIDNGIAIINHSVGWYNTNFYDGTGTVADIANNARDNGILWVNAAGNEASDGHWQGAFVDSDGDGYLDVGSGTDYLDGDSIDEGNRIYLASGDTVNIYMTWDDWSASNQDYDLYLYDSSGTMVASSTGNQSGTQQPVEELSYTATSAGYYEIAIYDYSAPTHPQIEFFAFTDNSAALNLEYHHPESTIVAPANSAKVLTAGAIRRSNWTTGPQEYFSSQGPSNASKYAASITKPDICGPDGTSSYTYGTFYGTSAATPHVAGAAALLLSEDPTLTADQLQAKLENDAIDMGAAGKDNLYGSGRLNLQLETGTSAVFRVDKTGNVYADGAYYGTGFYTGSADIAEWVPVSEPVEPGDVLELDPDHAGHYRKSRGSCSTLVAGVVSTDPGFVLGSPTPDSRLPTPDMALLALLGIVPMKATDEGGPIQPGDLLTTSSVDGYAMKWNREDGLACSLVAKALEALDSGTGVIQVLLMR